MVMDLLDAKYYEQLPLRPQRRIFEACYDPRGKVSPQNGASFFRVGE